MASKTVIRRDTPTSSCGQPEERDGHLSVLAWSLTFLFGLQTSGLLTPLGGGQRFDFTTVDGFAQQCEYHVVLPEREREMMMMIIITMDIYMAQNPMLNLRHNAPYKRMQKNI